MSEQQNEMDITERVRQVVEIALLIYLIMMPLVNWGSLPETIPSHFNAEGIVDDYGSRFLVFIPMGIGLLLFGFMKWLSLHPEMYNYWVKITEENKAKQYEIAVKFINWMNISMILVMCIVTYILIESAKNNQPMISGYMLPLIFVITLVPIVWYLIVLRNNK